MKTILLLIVHGVVYRGYKKVCDGASWAQLVAGAYGVCRDLFASTDEKNG
jgi:hypothetical protein